MLEYINDILTAYRRGLLTEDEAIDGVIMMTQIGNATWMQHINHGKWQKLIKNLKESE